ncbi:MAG: CRISPR-associated protein Cas4 [Planctomycetia bacterium]|mgnify:CR=1 FL=1|uniref:CRISPR-associated exonuclease Cas4 n=1 Tax=Candidatus Brocadia sapporoensis TaxID=392547 RepID=A0A1V6M3R5_9BACT|nr:CRISPR-associated protein Cas4 [Candidatus Brocadia sapporoensis]MCC7238387.1 CRISPR-associated protein Cas4 [Candidatus Brocadia sp.]QOJ06448.1 MAG: CRISPR-associated protein Cas4 [Planctomycetia bacterium]TVL94733.1 MAG: CRISPR-associated protein Cas4 [Candidatus Brocadia sp. BL1]OQD47033.1 CRISPR-associated protein Cas4 [Candidatus Brocadia sapporoensis]HQU32401.1 CRISPR-associated protein Cas4 [Candidatus Brocadia sapporoensis]
MYNEDDLVPISALADFTFCERRAALHFIECVWEDNVCTAEGTILHERVDDASFSETRGSVRIVRSVWLRSLVLGLVGKADMVEFHKTATVGVKLEGASGLWVPFPVEYKRGYLRHELSFAIQLCAQAICLEEMLGGNISTGAIFYGKTMRRMDVAFDDALRQRTEDAARKVHELIDSGITPKAEYSKKCKQCSLLNLCMPKVSKKASNYLMNVVDSASEAKEEAKND